MLEKQEEPTPPMPRLPTVTGWGACPRGSLMKGLLAFAMKAECIFPLRALPRE